MSTFARSFLSSALRLTLATLGLCAATVHADDASWRVTSLDPATQGSEPGGRLLALADGNLVGTARSGGPHNAGSVFRIDAMGKVHTLHIFDGSDGYGPIAGLTQGTDGLFYGTTALGAANGLGGVFRIDLQGNFELVHSFDESLDRGASGVSSALTLGPDGNFYGTSPMSVGFPRNTGALFRMSPAGEVTILHVFDVRVRQPFAGVTFAPNGRLYGLASSDANKDCGFVYSVLTDGTDFRAEHPLNHNHEGCRPLASLVLAPDGLLYGTTQYGGPRGGVGALFSYDPTTQVATTLHVFHDFDPVGNQAGAGVSLGADGVLYGATAFGGPQGMGAIYKRGRDGKMRLLHGISSKGKDGSAPQSAPVLDGANHLVGGLSNEGDKQGGTIYRLKLEKGQNH